MQCIALHRPEEDLATELLHDSTVICRCSFSRRSALMHAHVQQVAALWAVMICWYFHHAFN